MEECGCYTLFDSADSRKPLKVSELKKKVKSVFQEVLPVKREHWVWDREM